MSSRFPSIVFPLALAWMAGATPSSAIAGQEQAAPAAADIAGVQEQAPAPNAAEVLLLAMADTLGQARAFSVHMRTGYDAVQPTGQKIEYVESRDVLVRRPDKLRIDSTSSEGDKDLLVFDGKGLTVSTPKEKVYAQADKPGTLDEAVRYYRRDLGMRLPLAAMLLTTLRGELERRMESADYVETAAMCDGKYDHVAAVGHDIDMQVWIARKGPPLPKRIVLTYKHATGEPQFWADFSDWDLSPWAWNSKFEFHPPKDTRRIAFLPQLRHVTPDVPQ